ncbi:DUF4256 domain-containing protein [Terriglobus roseus]|uniref:DUF4256 domain-containing protein n=1 Tax=Terriglobus roseus TaxID=392734 RepID=A0A1H4R2P3_9BACT|nr:DUF4256 domain-containing protein [Terriglobus roseus]SEC25981.1 Protein of unknown function [Terriglobus roseus]
MPAGKLSKKQQDALLAILKDRFTKHEARHKGLSWADVQVRLEAQPEALRSLSAMEASGGEPDVIGQDADSAQYIFCDCSAESPEGRRNICYDPRGYEKRRDEGLPVSGSALGMAAEMGIEVLDEEHYGLLQSLGSFDTKSQSWLKTPSEVAKLGGGIFGDRRFGRVFVYHNTPQSFYRARGFRGMLKV